MIDILYFTYNRIAYTKQTLPAMIENAGVHFSLTIVDNASTDGTVDYLREMAKRYKKTIRKIIFNNTNEGLSGPTNEFWRTSEAEFIGKVDNDTLVPPGWLARLYEAQQKSDKFGVIGGFHFNMDYVNKEALEKRVVTLDGVSFIPDAFIGGCCYIFRKSLQRRFKYLTITPGKKTFGWTEYQQEMCRKGYWNGYLYPLLHVEHFDDPLNPHNLSFSEHAETSKISLSDKNVPMNRKSLLAWYLKDIRRVESGEFLRELNIDVRRYFGNSPE